MIFSYLLANVPQGPKLVNVPPPSSLGGLIDLASRSRRSGFSFRRQVNIGFDGNYGEPLVAKQIFPYLSFAVVKVIYIYINILGPWPPWCW